MKKPVDIKIYSEYETCRIDIKNSSHLSNSIELLNCSDKNVKSDYPKWFKDNKGSGCVITSNNSPFDVTIKCINDGELNIYLRGLDIRDENDARLPYYTTYYSFKINEIKQIDKETLVTHNDPFLVKRDVSDGEIINIHVEWSMTKFKFDIAEVYKIKKYVSDLKKENEKQKAILNSYNQLFNTLFLDMELESLPLLNNIKNACLELLIFIDNVCKKYELNWWLDYGTLLGAVRHGGYIPWDDDVDIGMTRKDGEMFFSIIKSEIKKNNLEDILRTNFKHRVNGKIDACRTVLYKEKGKRLMAAVDIFLYDFMPEIPPNFREDYRKERNIFNEKYQQGADLETACNEALLHLNLNKNYDKYMVMGIEGSAFKIYESENIFPLTQISFEGKIFPCPKNYRHYLEVIYGSDYLEIPQLLKIHNRAKFFRADEEIFSDYKNYFKRMQKVNKNLELYL